MRRATPAGIERGTICRRRRRPAIALSFVLLLLTAGPAGRGQEGSTRRPDRQVPTKPFRIIGNIYYVGQTDNSEQCPSCSLIAWICPSPLQVDTIKSYPQSQSVLSPHLCPDGLCRTLTRAGLRWDFWSCLPIGVYQ